MPGQYRPPANCGENEALLIRDKDPDRIEAIILPCGLTSCDAVVIITNFGIDTTPGCAAFEAWEKAQDQA